VVNHHLEQIAQGVYKSWFVDFEPWGGVMPKNWNKGCLDDIIELFDSKRIPLSSNQREKMEKLFPYYGAATLMDYVDDYLFDGIYLLLGEDGTVIDDSGFPILQYVWGKFWVNNHAHVLKFPNLTIQKFVEIYINSIKIDEYVSGMAQPKLNQAMLNKIPIPIPSLPEQQSIVRQLDSLKAKTQKLETVYNKKISDLEELKKSILQEAFRGQI